MATIRKNSFKKIESILRSAVLIREVRIDDMGDTLDSVSADRVLDCGRKYEFDRCCEYEDTATFTIHGNWFFTAYKSINGARQSLTPQAFARYFPNAA